VRIEDTPLIATTNEPVRLQLYSSTVRPDDREGELIPLYASPAGPVFHPLPPATTILATSPSDTPPSAATPPTLPVQLAIQLTEVGSLSLSCITRDLPHRWTIEFHLTDEKRHSNQPQPATNTDSAKKLISSIFTKGSTEPPTSLLSRLEKLLTTPRDDWNLPTLRALWSPLADSLTRRGKSAKHEVAWLQCAGHALRPGLGDESDSLRINELWRIRTIGTPHKREPAVTLATQILWRRVAAGLSAERQRELYEELIKGELTNPETFRLLSSLERLPQSAKEQLVSRSIKLLNSSSKDTQILGLWCITRLATREPIYAPPRYALDWDAAVKVVKRLMGLPNLPEPHLSRALALIIRGVKIDPTENYDSSTINLAIASLDGEWRDIALGLSDVRFEAGSPGIFDSGLIGDSLPPGIVFGGRDDS
jgi:hypothetical protein